MYRNCSSNDDDNDNIDKYIIYKYNNIHEYVRSNNDSGRGGGDDDENNNDNSMQK